MSKQEKRKGAARSRGSSVVAAPFEPTNLQCIAVIAGLVLVFFHQILLGKAYFWEDFIYQNYPFRSFAATSLAMGQLPLWNPYTFNGMPFLADIQTTVFYLPMLLLTVFVSDGTLNFYWLQLVIILHFMLAGIGMFYLAKSFNLKNIPSLFAGVAYMLSGYMIVHTIHQQNVTLVAWFPLVLLFFRKALNEQRWLYVFVTALVLGHSILAGYPQLSLYLYLLLGVYFLFELLTRFKGKQLLLPSALNMSAKAVSVVLISLALAMVQLMPTFELSDLSQRAEMTFEKASEGSASWSQLATLFFPKMFGTAGAGGYEYFGPGQYFYYWETCLYLGILPLLLTLLSFSLWRKNKYVPVFLGITVFSLLFALGENFFLFKVFYDFIPGFSTFRIPARMGILLTFSAGLLSAFSLQAMLYDQKTRDEQNRMRNILLGTGVAGLVLAGLAISGTFTGSLTAAQFAQVASNVKGTTLLSMFVLLVSITILIAAVRAKSGRFLGIVLIGLFFVDMFLFGGSQNNGRIHPGDYFKQRRDLVEFFRKDGESDLFRVNTRNAHGMLPGWDRNQAMVDRIFTMEGYTPLALLRAYAPLATGEQSFDLLNVKYKTVFDERTGQQTLVEHTTRLPRAFFVYDVHLAPGDDEVKAYIGSSAFNHRTTAVIEKPLPFSIAATGAASNQAVITSYTNNAIGIRATTGADGFLVLSEIFYPGWVAYVDGVETEIYRTNYNLRGIPVRAGEHSIEVRFEPASFRGGAWISVAALLLCAAGIVVTRRPAGRVAEAAAA